MPTILLTGGTGRLGRAILEHPTSGRHRVRIMSRRPAPVDLPASHEWASADLASGDGLPAAVEGIDVILHSASDPRGDPRAVDVEGTRRLVDAALAAGVPHMVFPSIVGIDRMPFPYYAAKVEAERIIAESGLPHTTVRITQFHSFVEELLLGFSKGPFVLLPAGALIQSIAVEEAAGLVLGLCEASPRGRIADVGGPEALTLVEMARSWARARRRRRFVIGLPLPGALVRGFRRGFATVPDGRVGRETWRQWLARS